MSDQSRPAAPARDITRPSSPWDSPFAWAFPPERPARRPGLIARLLARIRPPSGNHHVIPGPAGPAGAAEPPRPPVPDGVSPAMMTMLDLPPVRVPLYMAVTEQHQRGRHHHG